MSLDARRFSALRYLAKTYYPVIARSTELSLLFNDHHCHSRDPVSQRHLAIELSVLDGALAQRVVVEDRLMADLEKPSSQTDISP